MTHAVSRHLHVRPDARHAGDLHAQLSRASRRVVGLLLLLALVACGQLPRPFKSTPEHPYPLAELKLDAGVEVPPVTGVALPFGKLLAKRVAKVLTGYGVPAAAENLPTAGLVLKGHAKRAPPGKPYVAVITWRLYTASGKLKGEFRHGVGGQLWQWEYGSPAVIEAVGKLVGPPIAKLVLGERFAGRSATMPQVGIWFRGVQGAPGDGDDALQAALVNALEDHHIQLVNDPVQARYHLIGDVALSKPLGGQQIVRITWTLSYPDGHEIGKARQRNAIVAGSLDEHWGRTAVYAAAAAVGGIRDLMQQAEPSTAGDKTSSGPPIRTSGSSGGMDETVPAKLPVPKLPHIPGRALPPS